VASRQGGQPASAPKVGLNKVTWSTFLAANAGGRAVAAVVEAARAAVDRAALRGARGAPPGVYRVVLNVDGRSTRRPSAWKADPNVLRNGAADEEDVPGLRQNQLRI